MRSWFAIALALVAGGGIGAVVGYGMGRKAAGQEAADAADAKAIDDAFDEWEMGSLAGPARS